MSARRVVYTASETETSELARSLAQALTPGSVVALNGAIGAGKTVFARALARALGVTGLVTSPTYTLINEYDGRVPVYHLDLYRIDSIEECEMLGIEEYLWSDGITIIEWSEKAAALLPGHTVHVRIDIEDPDRRRIEITRP